MPVSTNPRGRTLTPQPSSQLVAGSAPTNKNRLRMSSVNTSGESRLRQRTRSSEASLAAFQPDHLGVEDQLDIRRRLDALNQVARHAGA